MKKLNLIPLSVFKLIICSLLLFTNTVQAQQVATEILDDVVITRTDYNAVIKVLFKRPLTYLSHSPANTGNTINVRVNLLGDFSRSRLNPIENESININSDTGLTEVIFEKIGNSSNSITFYFHKPVSYNVIQSSDQRSLSIVVYGLD